MGGAGSVAQSAEGVGGAGGGAMFLEILPGHFLFERVLFETPKTEGAPAREGHKLDAGLFA
jgi:hypothetical protein